MTKTCIHVGAGDGVVLLFIFCFKFYTFDLVWFVAAFVPFSHHCPDCWKNSLATVITMASVSASTLTKAMCKIKCLRTFRNEYININSIFMVRVVCSMLVISHITLSEVTVQVGPF